MSEEQQQQQEMDPRARKAMDAYCHLVDVLTRGKRTAFLEVELTVQEGKITEGGLEFRIHESIL